MNVNKTNSQTVLVTGCSSGIGYCVAHGLKLRGYHVIATARAISDVERLRHEGLDTLQLDLSDSQSIKRAVSEVLTLAQGRLYALFNNAAYGQPGAIEDLRREVLREQFETNVFGTVELTNLLIPTLREQGRGRIIQNSSVLGFVSLPLRGAYNASKYALEGISDTLRLELKGSGISVSLIEPGPIESHFRANAFAMFKKNIEVQGSPHRDLYLQTENRLTQDGPAVPFTLPPTAVLKRVIHALESPRPKTRYFVTFPTYFFALLKRLLTDKALDRILAMTSKPAKK
ncbi:MAG: SDR family NAD(P)-dependent oxidoreductase [Thiohalomonadales bacterium]